MEIKIQIRGDNARQYEKLYHWLLNNPNGDLKNFTDSKTLLNTSYTITDYKGYNYEEDTNSWWAGYILDVTVSCDNADFTNLKSFLNDLSYELPEDYCVINNNTVDFYVLDNDTKTYITTGFAPESYIIHNRKSNVYETTNGTGSVISFLKEDNYLPRKIIDTLEDTKFRVEDNTNIIYENTIKLNEILKDTDYYIYPCIIDIASLDNVVTTSEAAEIVNSTPDIIKQLCLRGKLIARKSGKTWLIAKKSVIEYFSTK